uniref:universal stress protein n=1 Tax=Candidatus Electrothrix sp. TaxID=2170559 RepID=UPI0040574463
MKTQNDANNDTNVLQPVQDLLVCLDLTAIDPYLIRCAADLALGVSAGKVIFFHAIQAYDLPEKDSGDFPDVETELRQVIHQSVHEAVDTHFANTCEWEIVTRVAEEDAAGEVVEYAKGKRIEMIIIGQKQGENREAHYSRKIAVQTGSDILFVPKNGKGFDAPILCAIDFSDTSMSAFERSLDLSRGWEVPLVCYAISDPTRAYFPGSTERSASHEQKRSQKAFEAFLDQYDLSPEQVSCRIEKTDQTSNEAEKIYSAAQQEKAGLIIVGATGKKSKETSLLGNLCASFRGMNKEIPVMVMTGHSS